MAQVEIAFKTDGEAYWMLRVTDSRKLPLPGDQPEEAGSFGWSMIHTMTSKLRGSLEIEHSATGQTCFLLRIPHRKHRPGESVAPVPKVLS